MISPLRMIWSGSTVDRCLRFHNESTQLRMGRMASWKHSWIWANFVEFRRVCTDSVYKLWIYLSSNVVPKYKTLILFMFLLSGMTKNSPNCVCLLILYSLLIIRICTAKSHSSTPKRQRCLSSAIFSFMFPMSSSYSPIGCLPRWQMGNGHQMWQVLGI